MNTERGPERGERIEDLAESLKSLHTDFHPTLPILQREIKSHDGIQLQAIVFNPTPTAGGNGKNPLLIFVSSWGLNKWEYVIPAHSYAEHGYTVISYTARGFWGSGGKIDLAGPLDLLDVQTVIDWALTHTNADPERIGMSGISYGGGISLLAAAKYLRIKSVVAMSAWVDLADSFLGNGETIRQGAIKALQGAATVTGRASQVLLDLYTNYFGNKNVPAMIELARGKSANTVISDINANGTAIFFANAYSDSLFTPNQFPDFFNALTTQNKHLEFAEGDHVAPELGGLFGFPVEVWTRARQWNDHYLREAKTVPLPNTFPVIVRALKSSTDEFYKTWDEVSNSNLEFHLEKDSHGHLGLVKQSGTVDHSIDYMIRTGMNSGMSGGIPFISGSIQPLTKISVPIFMQMIHPLLAAVFESKPFPHQTKIRGIAKVNLTIVPGSSEDGTLVMYLVDVDQHTKTGRLISFAPWTFKDKTKKEEADLSNLEITLTAYDIPAGNSLALIIQSHDPLFLDQSRFHSKITFVKGSLSLPIRADV
jgi:pimeloyl-ACP methyl ester carboxylesterase